MSKFEEVGNAFVQHYYNTFDQNRQNLAPLYVRRCCMNPLIYIFFQYFLSIIIFSHTHSLYPQQDNSLMTWEGDKIQGRVKILEKLGVCVHS